MPWPWQRTETRADLGHAIGDKAIEIASTRDTPTSDLAVAESCAGVYARCFAAARVSGTEMLPPSILAVTGRALLIRGEAAFAMMADGTLIPAENWDVLGRSPDPMQWVYRLHYAAPRGTESMIAPAEAVLHFRIGTTPGAPWRGRSPLAQISGLHGAVVSSLSSASDPLLRSQTLGVDTRKDDGTPILSIDEYTRVKEIVETEYSGPRTGRRKIPLLPPGVKVQAANRGGAEPGEASLYEASAVALAAAAGVPMNLLDGSGDGAAARESYRRMTRSVIEPIGRIVAEEASLKIGAPVRLSFRELRASDMTAAGRAFAQFVKAEGIDTERALRLAGLVEEDE